MKRISYYIVAIVVLGAAFVALWTYEKYFKASGTNYVSFAVLRGDLQESVKVRGTVVPQTEFDLAFPTGGIVASVFVSEGEKVAADAPLMQLDTASLEIARDQEVAVLDQQKASLGKLLSGATAADINVSQMKVVSAEQTLADARTSLLNTMAVAFTQSDDAVRNKADVMFSNPTSAQPIFNPALPDAQLEADIEAQREALETTLKTWRLALATATQTSAQTASQDVVSRLAAVKAFLDDVALGVNTAVPSSSIPQASLDAWKASIATARVNVDTALTNVIAAQQAVADADSALSVAQSELALKTSKPRPEDIAIAQAQVDQSAAQIASIDEEIRQSTLRAPSAGIVRKLVLKKSETAVAGVSAVVFSTSGEKMQADVTELSIGSVHLGLQHNASIVFDALPEKAFTGTVAAIEPQEVVKDNDVYYRTDITIDDATPDIRSGMNADVVITGEKHTNVLIIPELAVYKRGSSSFVETAPQGTPLSALSPSTLREQEIETGISDGESIEVLKGLSEGDIVVAPTQ